MKIRNVNITFVMPDGEVAKRLTTDSVVTWITQGKMFKKMNDKWYEVKNFEFIDCEEPIIEKEFKIMKLW